MAPGKGEREGNLRPAYRSMSLLILTLILITELCVSGVEATPPINLTSKNITVPYSGYLGLQTGETNSGPTTKANISLLYRYNKESIRQAGNITSIDVFYNSSTLHPGNVTGYFVEVWHQLQNMNNTWEKTGSCNISSQLIKGQIVNASLCGGISTQEGDLLGSTIYGTGDAVYLTVLSGATVFFQNPTPPTTYNWSLASSLSYIHTLKTYGASPAFVSIGDSLTAGYPLHRSGIEHAQSTENVTNQYPYQLSQLLTGTPPYQNMGISGQSCSQIKARFVSDAVNLSPNVIILMCGQNDYSAGLTNTTAYVDNITSMVDTAIANNITPIVIEMTPNSLGTTGQMQTRDSWTALLEQEIATNYTGTKGFAYLVNSSNYTGQFRVGGDAGNLWDIQPNMISPSGDGHFNETGYTALAQAVADKINAVNGAALNAQFLPPGPALSVQYPNGIAFTDTSTGTPTIWNWSWGDGSFSTDQNPYHFWWWPGTYTVSLNASTSTAYSTNSTVVNVMGWW